MHTIETSPRLDSIRALIERKDLGQLRSTLLKIHPADVADVVIELPAEEEAVVFRVLPKEQAAAVFSYLPLQDQQQLLKSLSSDQMLALVNDMTPDDRARLFEELPAEVTKRLLSSLSPEELKSARLLLGYPERTAGRYMTPEYVAIGPEMNAAQALEFVRRNGQGKETLNFVYIVDDNGRLVEDLKLGSLVLAEPSENVLAIKDPPLVCVKASDQRQEVLQTFSKYDRVALPVVDSDGKMLGIITIDDVLEAAERRGTEQMQRLGGMDSLDEPYTQVSTWTMIRKRGGWLSALFLGEMLTATAMSYFEVEIAKAVVLALFVPLIISSGGNSGSQATSLIIRALALEELTLRDWFRVFKREIFSGLALGILLGAIGFLRIALWQHLHFTNYGQHFYLIAFTVWVSLIGVVMFGTLAGSMLPFILRRLGFDPATSSAPFVATLVDVTGLIIYFTVAFVILRGTLL